MRTWISTDILRGTVALLLCRAKHPGSSAAMSTGHQAVKGLLRSSQNLFSEEERKQQRVFLEKMKKNLARRNVSGMILRTELDKKLCFLQCILVLAWKC